APVDHGQQRSSQDEHSLDEGPRQSSSWWIWTGHSLSPGFELVLNGPSDPARHGTIIVPGAASSLRKGLGREPDRHHFRAPRTATPRRPLRFLVLGTGGELMLLAAGRLRLRGPRSSISR